jgi:hypothetical protein
MTKPLRQDNTLRRRSGCAGQAENTASPELVEGKTIICLKLFDFARICQNRFEPVPKSPV